MKDDLIVGLNWDRNEDAIRQTQRKYGAYLSRVAYNILSDFEDSKECVNDTYLAALNSMPTHRPGVLSTYLGKIARQIAIDVFRRRKAINRFLRTLSDDERNTFIGRYYFFDSLKDVAAYCGMSEAKAKSMLYRTRQSLKTYLVW